MTGERGEGEQTSPRSWFSVSTRNILPGTILSGIIKNSSARRFNTGRVCILLWNSIVFFGFLRSMTHLTPVRSTNGSCVAMDGAFGFCLSFNERPFHATISSCILSIFDLDQPECFRSKQRAIDGWFGASQECPVRSFPRSAIFDSQGTSRFRAS